MSCSCEISRQMKPRYSNAVTFSTFAYLSWASAIGDWGSFDCDILRLIVYPKSKLRVDHLRIRVKCTGNGYYAC